MNSTDQEIRELFIKNCWRPDVRVWQGKAVWNGHHAIGLAGRPIQFYDGQSGRVMRRMQREDYWQLGRVRISPNDYWNARARDEAMQRAPEWRGRRLGSHIQ